MPVINGVYTKDFPDLGRTPADADIIPIAEVANQITYKTTIGAIFNAKIYGTTGRLTKFTGSNTVGNSILNEIGNAVHLTDGTSSYASFGIINPGTPGDPGVDNDCYIGSTINNDFTFRVNNVEAGRFDTALRFKISNIPNATTDTDKFLVSDGNIIKYRTGAELLSDIGAASSTGYVPYTGATANLDLGTHNLLTNAITLDPTPVTPPTAQGSIYFDGDTQTVAAVLNGVTMKIGEDTFYQIKNQSGAPIAKGTALRFDGVVGSSGRVKAVPFLANGTYPSIYFLGVAYEDIPNGGDGKALWFGKVRGVNTNAYPAGTILYASTTVAGGFQTTVPTAPNNIISVAAVVTQGTSNGTILVRPLIGSNINNDEGVKITSPTTGDLLQLQSSGLWENKSANNAGLVTLAGTQTITGAKTFSLDSSFNGVSIGRGAGNINTNTRVGLNALSSNTTGNANSAFGSTSLSANTTGHSNNAFGFYSLYSNISGYYNVGVGNYALGSNDTGHSNTAIGQEALTFNTSGYENVGVGIASLLSNTTGFSNTAVGSNALRSNTTGGYNTAVGDKSLYSITTGIYNTALGNTAGDLINSGGANQTSNYSVYLGYDTRASANGNTNEIVIGSGARGNGSNTVTIGNSSITDNYLSGSLSVDNDLYVGGAYTSPVKAQSGVNVQTGTGVFWKANVKTNTVSLAGIGENSSGLDFFTNSSFTTPALRLFANGNLGLGQTTDAGYKLDVNGMGRFASYVFGANFNSTVARSNTIDVGTTVNNLNYNFIGNGGWWGIRTNLSNEFNIDTYNANSPKNVLNIAQSGAATFSSSVTAGNGYFATGVNGDNSSISVNHTTDYTTLRSALSGTRSWQLDNVGGQFRVYMQGSTNSYALNVSTGGNVGIGTTSPGQKLTVENAGDTFIQIRNSSAGQNLFLGATSTDARITNDAATPFTFNLNGSERMRITSGGNVLIGTTTDNGAKLQVNGNTNILNPLTASKFTINNNANNSYNIELIRSDSTIMFSVEGHTGAGYLNSSAWSYGSDKRIKENIKYISTGLDKIMLLKPVKFDYINGNKNNIGWIAQDVQNVIPEAVSKLSENNDQLTLKSDFIIPYLVKAVQELKAEIDILKK